MEQELGRKRPGAIEQLADFARDRYVQATAGLIWASNIAYNSFVEGQSALTSIFNGITTPANAPLYSPKFEGLIGIVGALTQEAMYFTVAGTAVGVTSVVLDNRNVRREGRGTNRKKGSIILAECNGVPVFADLAQQLAKNGELGNVVLSKTSEVPSLNAQERGLFNVWIANAGGPEKDFFDTKFWERSGAKNADVVVLNSSNVNSSKEAAVVVREQLGNKTALIVIIDSRWDTVLREDLDPHTGTYRDQRTGAHIINIYSEVVAQMKRALHDKDVDFFIPQIDPKNVTPEYRRSLEQKRQMLRKKIERVKPLIDIYLVGDDKGDEHDGLRRALEANDFRIADRRTPYSAQVALYYGRGDLTDDSSVMDDGFRGAFKGRDNVIEIRVPFDRDNEDNAIGHGDATISIERAVNGRVAELLKPHIRYRTSLGKRLAKLKGN